MRRAEAEAGTSACSPERPSSTEVSVCSNQSWWKGWITIFLAPWPELVDVSEVHHVPTLAPPYASDSRHVPIGYQLPLTIPISLDTPAVGR